MSQSGKMKEPARREGVKQSLITTILQCSFTHAVVQDRTLDLNLKLVMGEDDGDGQMFSKFVQGVVTCTQVVAESVCSNEADGCDRCGERLEKKETLIRINLTSVDENCACGTGVEVTDFPDKSESDCAVLKNTAEPKQASVDPAESVTGSDDDDDEEEEEECSDDEIDETFEQFDTHMDEESDKAADDDQQKKTKTSDLSMDSVKNNEVFNTNTGRPPSILSTTREVCLSFESTERARKLFYKSFRGCGKRDITLRRDT
ncbi:RNA polymerase-associated protein LEO1-like [Haliotis rubra]|uniref:RNA polymerase-associated protein LEO1-like n=1 Tax=Haliotis rubra TaxID=36100 RepID=UPI001EE59F2F|nr:RNA polymerase-associated protein LEO1-like [Haliotis rubra]XP_046558285.1 RNA polymerase-associated protein LEO1-like [Haliotis rubra]